MEDKNSAPNDSKHLYFNMLLISSLMEFLCTRILSRYLSCSTVSNHSLPIFYVVIFPDCGSRDTTVDLVFLAFDSGTTARILVALTDLLSSY
jgi:hypothetical protein